MLTCPRCGAPKVVHNVAKPPALVTRLSCMACDRLVRQLDAIANHPAILESCAPGFVNISISKFWDDPDNFCLMDEHGAAIVARVEGSLFEGHFLYLPTRRGLEAKKFTVKALALSFANPRIGAIEGHVSCNHRAARQMARAVGFERRGNSVDSLGRPCVRYLMERERWAELSAE